LYNIRACEGVVGLMIGNALEQSIIAVFQDDLSSTFSINAISKKLEKSYPIIHKKSNFFLKEGVLKKINVGRAYQCFLNFQNDKAKVFMAINEINRRDSFVHKTKRFENVMEELSQLIQKFSIDSIILYKKTLIFIVPNNKQKSEILEMSVLTKDFNILFFDRNSFQENFLDNTDMQKYHFILYNPHIYVDIISEVSDKILMKSLIQKTGRL